MKCTYLQSYVIELKAVLDYILDILYLHNCNIATQRLSHLKIVNASYYRTSQVNTKDSGSTVPNILNLGTRWKCVASFTPRPLYLHIKSRQHPWKRDWGISRTCPDIFQKEKSSYSGIDPQFLGSPDRSQSLYRIPTGKQPESIAGFSILAQIVLLLTQ
jgi:hypothetical protein